MKFDYTINFIEKEFSPNYYDEKIIHNQNSRRNKVKLTKEIYEKTEIIWSLRKYISPKIYDGIDWQHQSSSENLNNGISAIQLLEKFNTNKTLNEFNLQKNDLLIISMRYIIEEKNKKTRPFIGKYISFIFDEKWLINSGFEHIDNNYQDYKSGILLIN